MSASSLYFPKLWPSIASVTLKSMDELKNPYNPPQTTANKLAEDAKEQFADNSLPMLIKRQGGCVKVFSYCLLLFLTGLALVVLLFATCIGLISY